MKRIFKYMVLALVPVLFYGCRQIPENPNAPHAYINFTISLSDMNYQELQFVGNYKELTSDPESSSRGIIVYRMSQDEFLAYDRLPPNYPNACTDSQGNTTRLVVELPFIVDHCNNAYYNILNGEIFISEDPEKIPSFIGDEYIYPLFQYHTIFDGVRLTVYN